MFFSVITLVSLLFLAFPGRRRGGGGISLVVACWVIALFFTPVSLPLLQVVSDLSLSFSFCCMSIRMMELGFLFSGRG
jgi:hypothetical protein